MVLSAMINNEYDFILKGLEKQISKFILFLYLFILNILTLSVVIESDNDKKNFDEFISFVKENSKIRIDQGNNFKKINELYM